MDIKELLDEANIIKITCLNPAIPKMKIPPFYAGKDYTKFILKSTKYLKENFPDNEYAKEYIERVENKTEHYQSRFNELIAILELLNEEVGKMDISQENYSEIIKKFCRKIKKEGLETKYGLIENITDQGKQGGNGKVLFGVLNKTNVAIKILFQSSEEKKKRFLEEYVNVILKLQKQQGIIEEYLYDEYIYDGIKIPYIVMKRYTGVLTNTYVTEKSVIDLFNELCSILDTIHSVGIIHRDLKPSNILLDENNDIVITDFGIAYYNPENYDLTGHTKNGEILGNREFSPPEQNKKDAIPDRTMDIYALGQIIQWYVTKSSTHGTNRMHLYNEIDTVNMRNLDIIIEKCLSDNPVDRYHNISEIREDLKKFNIKYETPERKEDRMYV